jgi:hypothetical protein
MSGLAKYRKAIVAALAASGVIAAELPSNSPEWLSGLLAVAGALGVYLVRNAPPPARSRQEARRSAVRPPTPPPTT